MNYQTPEASKLADMLTMVMGVDASAAVGKSPDLSGHNNVALYVNRDGDVVATCSCDLTTAAALGCGLSMIPPGGAEGMVEDGELSKMANDNFYEMMNIFSSLLMNDKSAHLKLTEVVVDADKRLQADGSEQVAFDLDLGKYGKGNLVFDFT